MSTDIKAALGKLNDAAIRSVLSYLNENYRSQISFIQFGANDGKRGDPINAFAKRHSWSGIVVEPVPEYFSKLENEYKDSPGICLEKVAISSSSGTFKMYFVPFDLVPNDRPWEQGLASADYDHLISNNVEADRIKEIQVDVLTPRQLLSRYPALKFNVLVIDVEGHEFDIISSFPFEETRPDCVVFESKHIPEDKYNSIHSKLKSVGYQTYKMQNDAISFLQPPSWLNVFLSELQRISSA